jgi:predicted GNAT superfamily acetyltransferase
MTDGGITVRECVSIEDFQQCIELERAVWKDDDIGIMPIRLYMISKACNAPTIGAFDEGGKLVGFVHTMLALWGPNVVYHSHLAAVIEDLRHQDIGTRMKLAQRDCALRAGVPLITWTFDPLQSRNAHLNINKLGAIIRRYEANYYGEGLSTVFGEHFPSDRVFAEWWVSSPHVHATLSRGAQRLDNVEGFVAIPEDIGSVHRRSIEDHARWQQTVRRDFKAQLGHGLIVRGFERNPGTGQSRYLFGADQPQFSFAAYRSNNQSPDIGGPGLPPRSRDAAVDATGKSS